MKSRVESTLPRRTVRTMPMHKQGTSETLNEAVLRAEAMPAEARPGASSGATRIVQARLLLRSFAP